MIRIGIAEEAGLACVDAPSAANRVGALTHEVSVGFGCRRVDNEGASILERSPRSDTGFARRLVRGHLRAAGAERKQSYGCQSLRVHRSPP